MCSDGEKRRNRATSAKWSANIYSGMTTDFLLNGYILEKLTYYEWGDCTSNITAVFYRQSMYLLETYFLFFYSFTDPGYFTKRGTVIFCK